MSTDPHRVKGLFAAALDLPDRAARTALLDRECAGDPDLRRRVDALLAAHEQPELALERPLGVDAATGAFEPRAETPGTVIANKYKLLEPIGEGGMGHVWVADQLEPIRRRVALKLIKPGMDSAQVLARFEAERQALALMDHPNIAKVLDAGTTPEGRPYFAMELVKGTPITDFCDARRLSPRERLELFVPVCQAIQHAHQKGVIHRDVKPSNVLVALHDERPVPKVIDFGVAKAVGQQLTEKTIYTGLGALVGTPAYMAPEQATFNQLDVDTRADVYALGVLLYELLAGSPPFEPERLKKAALDEVLRLVREEEPPRPSARLSTSEARASIAALRQSDPAKLSKLMKGELDWIVMKALEKDRNRRYETANSIATDVQRYLADEPVLACPPSAGYRLRKFARRNKGTLGIAGALGLALLVAFGGVGWAARDRSAWQAEADRERSDRHARLAREVDAALQDFDAVRGQALARTADPGQWGATLAEARSVLARADGFAAEDPDALGPECRSRLEAARAALAADTADHRFAVRFEQIRLAQIGIGVRRGEWGHQRVLPDLAAALVDCYGIDPAATPADEAAGLIRGRPAPVRELLSVALELGRALEAALTRAPRAEAEWMAAVADRADDDPWRRRARAAAAASDWAGLEALTDEPAAGRQPAAVFEALAWRFPAGSPEIVRFRRRAQRLHPGDFWVNVDMANELYLGCSPPRPAEAVRFYGAALAVRPECPNAWVNLGAALGLLGDRGAAEAACREALRLAPDFAYGHRILGSVLRRHGRVNEAIAECRKAIELAPESVAAHISLAQALAAQGKLDLAVAECRRAIDLDPKSAAAHNAVAWFLATAPEARLWDPAEAVRLATKAVELAPGANEWNTLGVAHYRAGDWAAATTALDRSMQMRNGGNVYDWFFLAMIHHRRGHPDEARRWFDEAVQWQEKNQPNNEELTRFRAEAEDLLGLKK